MNKLKLIVALAAAILMIILIFQNSQPVATKLLLVTITMPNSALIGVSLLVGMTFGIMVALLLSKKKETHKKVSQPESSH